MKTHSENKLENALKNFETIQSRINNKSIAFFFDYDGTLTPITSNPNLAKLSQAMRQCLQKLSKKFTVAIISGRELSNVRDLVGINSIYYAGNHGIEVAGPDFYETNDKIDSKFVEQLNKIDNDLNNKLKQFDGVYVENKKFSLSIHYRNVNENEVKKIENIVDAIVKNQDSLEKHHGKKVFELRPNIPWNKGDVVKKLLKQLNLNNSDVIPIYLGDDVTDEDAFVALENIGIRILISEEPKKSAADYFLNDPEEVKQFINKFIK